MTPGSSASPLGAEGSGCWRPVHLVPCRVDGRAVIGCLLVFEPESSRGGPLRGDQADSDQARRDQARRLSLASQLRRSARGFCG